jgi:hypothetical protein
VRSRHHLNSPIVACVSRQDGASGSRGESAHLRRNDV